MCCMSAPSDASSSIASIVGTNTEWVMRSRSIAANTAAGSKRGRITWVAPTHVQAKTFEVPATWNIGHTCSQRSAARVAGGREVVERVGEQVAMAEHHALGRAGRAAGVGDRRERVLVDAGRRHRRPGHQRLVVLEQLDPERLGHRAALGVDDQELDAGVAHHERELLGRQSR